MIRETEASNFQLSGSNTEVSAALFSRLPNPGYGAMGQFAAMISAKTVRHTLCPDYGAS